MSSPAGTLLESDAEGWSLFLGHLTSEEADEIGELVAAVQRARRGGIVAALLALARERERRLGEPGTAVLRIHEGSGRRSTADWSTGTELPERRAASR